MGDEKSIQSIERALDIMEAVAVYESGKSLTEISENVNLPKSTAFRIIATLMKRGYIDKTEAGNYKMGLKLIEDASYHINNLELQTEARPFVSEVTAHLGLTSYLGVLDGDQVVYVEKINTASAVKLYSQIGTRVHAYCSSLGKCMLANYSKEELEEIMKDCSFIKFTPNTISSMEELHKELAIVRSRGWALDDCEHEAGQRCIGAPIYDYKGDIIAAICANGDIHVLTDDRIEEVAEYVMKAAAEISRNLGYAE